MRRTLSRRPLWLLSALLACSLVCLDHYVVNKALSEFYDVSRQHRQQYALVYEASNCVDFARDVQEVSRLQAEEIYDLRGQVKRAAKMVSALNDELLRTQATLEKTAETIQELTDMNSQLNTTNEKSMQLIDSLTAELSSLELKVIALEKQLKATDKN